MDDKIGKVGPKTSRPGPLLPARAVVLARRIGSRRPHCRKSWLIASFSVKSRFARSRATSSGYLDGSALAYWTVALWTLSRVPETRDRGGHHPDPRAVGVQLAPMLEDPLGALPRGHSSKRPPPL